MSKKKKLMIDGWLGNVRITVSQHHAKIKGEVNGAEVEECIECGDDSLHEFYAKIGDYLFSLKMTSGQVMGLYNCLPMTKKV